MSQTDLNVANASGAVVRADLNDHFQALATNSSGATAPGTTFPHQWWFDESTNDLNQRNAGNTAWILVARKDGSGWTPYRQAALLGILATKNSNVLAKTAAYPVVVADDGKLIDADATTAAFTVTLPTVASAGDGFIISVKKTDSSANVVTVDGAGTETIDGATTKLLSAQFDTITLYCDGVEWHVVADTTGAASDGELRSVQVFEATGGNTWTKPAGLVRAHVIIVAGGGGGGGSGAANGLAGAGGGGGGYAEELLEASALGGTETATVGAGGAGGAAGANDGVAGGTSSFGSLLSATGGGAGSQGNTGSVNGAAGGVGSGGDINVTGGGGGAGIEDATNFDPVTGRGGETPLGGGSRTVHRKSTNSAGDAGSPYGGGGEGGARNASNAAGGNGADGVVIVWEYF